MKAIQKLSNLEITSDLLQKIADSAQDGLEIEVDLKDGRKLIFRKTNNEIGYTSFREKYNRFRQ